MKQLAVFLVLFIAYVCYSYVVYTAGAENKYSLMSATAVEGKELFQKHNCVSCHQLYGLGGYLGPELTNIYSYRKGNRDYSRAIMLSGTATMPDFGLSKKEADAILDYLAYVDAVANDGKNKSEN